VFSLGINPLVECNPSSAKSQRGKSSSILIRREKGNPVHVIGGPRFASHQPGMVDDDDVGSMLVLTSGDHVEQTGDLDLQPGLLAAFAHSSVRRGFIKLDETGGKGPRPLVRPHTPADEEYLALAFDNHASGDLEIAKDHPLAGRTKASHAPECFPIF
jgi:hypothetical protein